MTSNVGSTAIAKGNRGFIGFLIEEEKSTSYEGMKALVMEELKAYFRPELLNRIDEVVVFQPLEKEQVCCFPLISIEVALETSICRLLTVCWCFCTDSQDSGHNAARGEEKVNISGNWSGSN